MTVVGYAVASLAGAVTLTDDLRRTHERLLRDAVRLSGGTMTLAAQEAEIDQAQFTKQFQMLEGSHKRLAMQPPDFWRWYALAILHEFGLPAEMTLATRAKRMAKMALSSPERKRA